MSAQWMPVTDEGMLDRLLAGTRDKPLVIFKSSATCGTSAFAMDELQAYVAGDPFDAQYAIVTVQTHRAVSNAISARLGVRHQSPQVIIVRDEHVVWQASHFHVTAEELSTALMDSQAVSR